jgi:hypothetical protein
MPQPSRPSPPHCRLGTRTISRRVLCDGRSGTEGQLTRDSRQARSRRPAGDALKVVRVDVEPQRLVDVALDDVVEVVLIL